MFYLLRLETSFFLLCSLVKYDSFVNGELTHDGNTIKCKFSNELIMTVFDPIFNVFGDI